MHTPPYIPSKGVALKVMKGKNTASFPISWIRKQASQVLSHVLETYAPDSKNLMRMSLRIQI